MRLRRRRPATPKAGAEARSILAYREDVPSRSRIALLAALVLAACRPAGQAQGERPPGAARAERAVCKISYENDFLRAEGVGVFVAPGELLTCRHVVLGTDRVRIHARDGRTVEARAVLAESERLDAVLLEVPFDTERDAFLPLGTIPADTLPRPRVRAFLPARFVDDPEAGEGFGGRWWRGPILRRVAIPGGGELLGVALEVSPGHSGTPLLDDETLAVVGLGGFHRPVFAQTSRGNLAVRFFAVGADALRKRLTRFPRPVPLRKWSLDALRTPSGLVDAAGGAAGSINEKYPERLIARALEREPGHVEALVTRLTPRYLEILDRKDAAEEEVRSLLAEILEARRLARPRYAYDPLLVEQTWFWEARLRLRLGDRRGAEKALLAYTEGARFDPDGYTLLWRVAHDLGHDRTARAALRRFGLLVGD